MFSKRLARTYDVFDFEKCVQWLEIIGIIYSLAGTKGIKQRRGILRGIYFSTEGGPLVINRVLFPFVRHSRDVIRRFYVPSFKCKLIYLLSAPKRNGPKSLNDFVVVVDCFQAAITFR